MELRPLAENVPPATILEVEADISFNFANGAANSENKGQRNFGFNPKQCELYGQLRMQIKAFRDHYRSQGHFDIPPGPPSHP